MKVKITLLLVLFVLLSMGGFSDAQETSLPGISQNIKGVGKSMFTKIIDILKQVFGQLETVLGNIINWIYNFWQVHIWPWFQSTWNSIVRFFGTLFEEKMPSVKREFQREVKELTEEVPRLLNDLWQ